MKTDAKTEGVFEAESGKAAVGLLELSFVDQNGEDLGSYHVEDTQTVSEIIRDVVAESGLPSRNLNEKAKRYEGFQGGRKLAPTNTVREAMLETDEAIEVYPSVMTGGLS